VGTERPKVPLVVRELLANVQLKRGPYNSDALYGHVRAEPAGELVIELPVREVGNLMTVTELLQALGDAVALAIQGEARAMEARRDGPSEATGPPAPFGRGGLASAPRGEEPAPDDF